MPNRIHVHKLKTLPRQFDAVLLGNKTFELRVDDRGIQLGHTLILEEIEESDVPSRRRAYPGSNDTRKSGLYYTSRTITCAVTYVLRGQSAEHAGLRAGYAVFGIARKYTSG